MDISTLNIITFLLIVLVAILVYRNNEEIKRIDDSTDVLAHKMFINDELTRMLSHDVKHGLYRNRNDLSDYVIVFDTIENAENKPIIGFYHRSSTETGGLEWLDLEDFQKTYVPT